jgi:hypothetical protein
VVPTEPPPDTLHHAGEPVAPEGSLSRPAVHRETRRSPAREYVEAGYLWNSGIFVSRADTLIGELERLAPRGGSGLGSGGKAIRIRTSSGSIASRSKKCGGLSIDFAVMEHYRQGRRGAGHVRMVGRRQLVGCLGPSPKTSMATPCAVTWRCRHPEFLHPLRRILAAVVGMDSAIVTLPRFGARRFRRCERIVEDAGGKACCEPAT